RCPLRRGLPVPERSTGPTDPAGSIPPAPGGLRGARLRRSRWADELRIGRCRWVSSSWGLRRSHPQGREACGFAGRAVEQVRARHQRLDRPDARPHCAGQVAGCRRRGDRVNRREFITLFGGAAATWPQAAPLGVAFAQSNERVRVGYLWIGAEGSDGQTLSGVRQGLADVGLVAGRNLVIERRYADSHPERLSALAMELVRLDVAVLLAPGAVVTPPARSSTTTLLIVSVTNAPVALGFSHTLARPGGNVTGLAITASDQLVEKWVELLKDVTPALKRAALLYDPRPAPMIERVAHDASVTIGIEIM